MRSPSALAVATRRSTIGFRSTSTRSPAAKDSGALTPTTAIAARVHPAAAAVLFIVMLFSEIRSTVSAPRLLLSMPT